MLQTKKLTKKYFLNIYSSGPTEIHNIIHLINTNLILTIHYELGNLIIIPTLDMKK